MNAPKHKDILEMESTTSPWTELYTDEAAQDAEMHDKSKSASAPAQQAASEAERPTHDALATIFNDDWEGVLFSRARQ
jgi:hypothetical protein